MLDKLSPRFTVHRRIGAGGFGAVYDAQDHTRQARVALKRLTRVDANAIVRFKREFRALADVLHPNLVRLHELLSIGDDWFITMDLVEGVDFKSYVRGAADDEELASTTLDGPTDDAVDSDESMNAIEPARAEAQGTEQRLRAALGQLCAGVHALHQQAKLHRDLKPSNVLVTRAGRLVILDFGLVASLDNSDDSLMQGVRGTPGYMSPEQAGGRTVSEASDWYSVGVMLYEALRGRLPFAGSVRDMMAAKQTRDPPDPRIDRRDLPADLCELAMALLARDPERRPTGAEVLASLGVRAEAPPAVLPRRTAGPFVGRDAELEALRKALARVRQRAGAAVMVQVHGASGVGKTALVRRFLDERDLLVLDGRCHERESVPYKAIDGALDALAGYLRRLPETQAAELIPRDAAAVSRLFPSFTRVGSVGPIPARAVVADAREMRRRASAGLRDILAGLAGKHEVVLFLDDLQWGDADSAALIADLLAPPHPPAVLVVACYRDEDSASSGFLRALAVERARGAVGDARDIALAPLEDEDARALAAELLPPSASADTVARVARESGGNPHLLAELAQAARASRGDISVAALLDKRLAALSAGARELLDLCAVAARPLPYVVARHAAGLTGKEEVDAVSALRAGRMVRLTSAHEQQAIECFSNRIREAVTRRLEPTAVARLHRRLARTLEVASNPDPEALALHHCAAGDGAKARGYFEKAGDRASLVLAFDHAVGLYRNALDPASPDDARRLRIKLADALASAGHGVEAARAYLEAREGEPREQALLLSRRAGEQLLRCGHLDEGLDVMRGVLAEVGLDLPERPRFSLALHRMRLRVRGLRFRERAEKDVPREELLRIDACWSVGNGLGGVDLVRGADFQARHLLLALEAGEPYRIARALAWDAVLVALEGGPRRWRRAGDLGEAAERIAERIDHPHALAWAMSAAAVTAWAQSEWRRASTMCDFATALFRERCADIGREVASLDVLFNLPALFFLGDIGELGRRAPAVLEDAEARGDRYAAATLRSYAMPLLQLAIGQPDAARAAIAGARAGWSSSGWHLQHWGCALSDGEVALYEGRGGPAAAVLEGAWPRMEEARQLDMQNLRIQSLWLRGRLALAAGRRADALADARRLEGERVPYGRASALALRAGIAVAEDDGARAGRIFAKAEAAYQGLAMTLHALAMRWRRSELTDTSQVASAALEMSRAGVVDPPRLVAVLAPMPG